MYVLKVKKNVIKIGKKMKCHGFEGKEKGKGKSHLKVEKFIKSSSDFIKNTVSFMQKKYVNFFFEKSNYSEY